MIFDKLKQFRQSAYMVLGKGKDTIFDLMDAVLTSPRVNSFVELSLSPVFRRTWSSLYRSLITLSREKSCQDLGVVAPYAFQARFSNTFLYL